MHAHRSVPLPSVLLALAVALGALGVACDDGTSTTSSSSSAGGASSTASLSETVGAGGAKAEVTGLVETATFSLDCQPVVAADPVHGSFGAKYVNAGELDGELDIVSTKIVFTSNAKKLVWTIGVDPTASGAVPAGQTTNVTHTKTDGSGVGDDPTLHPCDFCTGTAQIEVTWKSKQLQQSGQKSLGLVQCAQ